MEDVKFEKAKEIEQEMKELLKFEDSLKIQGVSIVITYFDGWKKVKNSFDKDQWKENLTNIMFSGIDRRKKELEKEFKEL